MTRIASFYFVGKQLKQTSVFSLVLPLWSNKNSYIKIKLQRHRNRVALYRIHQYVEIGVHIPVYTYVYTYIHMYKCRCQECHWIFIKTGIGFLVVERNLRLVAGLRWDRVTRLGELPPVGLLYVCIRWAVFLINYVIIQILGPLFPRLKLWTDFDIKMASATFFHKLIWSPWFSGSMLWRMGRKSGCE
jgi:hypothetical protein